ncbi:low affinity immunoglobulin gamma Fc region receptor II-b-like [Aquarana catesbeiana]|uniref:low affinity immunoglobulin gamma Fc region receptor II-b-like n=1 Tax=Aquarana catesbeiana TaxID=8400 RepID=UPI003CC97004
MSVFFAIVFLSLNMGKSGGAIKPVVTFTPNWGNILGGDSVTLTCDVPSTVPEEPRTYHWYKDKRPIPGDQQRLHITKSLVGSDRGDYQCQTIGGDISDPVFLNVTYNEVILQRPPSVIYEGDPLILRCHHHRRLYNAKNTKFYKDDQEIKSSESDSTFHIPNITMSQSGLYKCTKQIQRYNRRTRYEMRSDVSFISVKGGDDIRCCESDRSTKSSLLDTSRSSISKDSSEFDVDEVMVEIEYENASSK